MIVKTVMLLSDGVEAPIGLFGPEMCAIRGRGRSHSIASGGVMS